MKTSEELKSLLEKIDHRGYPAYKETRGSYQFPGYILSIDHVQGDPFASPSKVSIHVQGRQGGFPSRLYDKPWKQTALEDALLREFSRQIEAFSFKARGSGKSGLISVSTCGQEVLSRSACSIDRTSGKITLRLEVGFPANGRTINAGELSRILFQFLPSCVKKSLFYRALDTKHLEKVMELSEDQQFIRNQLSHLGLTAFIANGSILPRATGVSQKPLKNARPFLAPPSMSVTLNLPYAGSVTGMGIKSGVTLIVGGGYHGKSTLLEALERGVYNHISGDGRELVITDPSAVKIRAEDGRSIHQVDISLFINDLPNGKNTHNFDTENASGSTSQAANIVEAIEAGTRLMLIDEDTSASNFMVRDALMESVVSADSEPITPLIHRIRSLYTDFSISSIIVAGSCGAYFDQADCVIQMDRYEPREITDLAHKKAEEFQKIIASDNGPGRSFCQSDSHDRFIPLVQPQFDRFPRSPYLQASEPDRQAKIRVNGKDGVSIGKSLIDLRYTEQLVDSEQLMALGYMLDYARRHFMDGQTTLTAVISQLEVLINQKGLASICEGNYLPAGLAMPLRQEIFACFNRCRELNFNRKQ